MPIYLEKIALEMIEQDHPVMIVAPEIGLNNNINCKKLNNDV